MRILLANPRGFCAGVNMAIAVVDQILDLCPETRPIYVYHEIVHNKHIVERFEQRGVVFVEMIDAVPKDAILVFSAHGISPAIREAAKQRNLRCIDATCPLVTKVHMEAIRYAAADRQILLIGHDGHDEVVGTIGEAPDAIQVVESVDDIASLSIKDADRLVYLTQTTLSQDDATIIIDALRAAFPNIKSPPTDDICYATTNRQNAVRQLSPLCDLVIVVGSRNSSNSKRLCELAEADGTDAYLVDDVTELKDVWFENAQNILVTSGASAPEYLVRKLIEYVVATFGATVQQYDFFREDMIFSLPPGLRALAIDHGHTLDTKGNGVETNNNIEGWIRSIHAIPPSPEPIRMTISATSNNQTPTND